MGIKYYASLVLAFLIGAFAISTRPALAFRTAVVIQTSAPVEFVAPDELKIKLARNQSVTILDVRASSDLTQSDSKIKGALHVKLRKLESRLTMPPLKSIARDSEVVTYCACPNDEASIRAAQLLKNAGFTRVRVLKGGWLSWKKANGQIEGRSRGI